MTYFPFLILGANGFIGQHLYSNLTAVYKVDDILCISRDEDHQKFRHYYSCDITDQDSLKKVLTSYDYGTVFYLIADINPSRDMNDFFNIFQTNLEGLKNTLEILKHVSLKRFVFFSTAELYGTDAYMCTEESLPNPISPYSLTKAMGEMLVKYYSNQYSLPYTIIRPSLVYGPCQNKRYFIPQAIDALLHQEQFDMTPGEQTRDFIYIDDFCDALIKIIQQDVFFNDTVNISSGQEILLKEIILELTTLLRSKTSINFGALSYRENEIMRYKIDNTKLKIETGWIKKTPLSKGLYNIVKTLSQ